jgi:hypothetical protein
LTPDDQSLLHKSPDEIDYMMGEALLRDELGSKDFSKEEKQSTGRRWFEMNINAMRLAICADPLIREAAFGSDKAERNLLCAAVIDSLVRAGPPPVPTAVLAVKIIHYGLDRLCGIYETRLT